MAAVVAASLGMPGLAVAGQINSGWNLVGNGRAAIIDVAATFGTPSAPVAGISDSVKTVWKWDAANTRWAFFTPTMDVNQLAAYSASKGYAVLKSILPGEGYWVNTTNAVTIPDPVGQPFLLNKWNLTGGWNLVSTGANATPAAFAASIAPFAATTVWAWDPASTGWYFYAPSLDANGTLANYITQKNYRNFIPPLADGLGFWVNRAVITGSPTANLPPLDQAKQMFSELRTTINSWVDTSKTGALDDQLTRMSGSATGIVGPNSLDLVYRMKAINAGTEMFRKIKAGGQAMYMTVTGQIGQVAATTFENGLQAPPGWFGFDPMNRMIGYPYYNCMTNYMTGSVSAVQLSSVSCHIYDNAYPASTLTWSDGTTTTFWDMNKMLQGITLVSSQTIERHTKITFSDAGAGKFNYLAELVEQVNNGAPTIIGPPYVGSIERTVSVAGITQSLALSGDLPSTRAGAGKLTVNASLSTSPVVGGPSKTVNSVVYSAYRHDITGSITGLDAQGGTAFSISMDAGTNLLAYEDALGNQPLDAAIALDFRGTATVAGIKISGSMLANSFMSDADGLNFSPTDVTVVGAFSDISTGGAGAIINGALMASSSNYGSYHSLQPESAANYIQGATTFNGTLKLPSRPTMGLTLTGTVTGPRAGTISGQYTYDNGLAITVSGTHDSNNPAANSLTLTNQDGITVTLPHVGSNTITKGTANLGTIINGIVYYADGYFESLK